MVVINQVRIHLKHDLATDTVCFHDDPVPRDEFQDRRRCVDLLLWPSSFGLHLKKEREKEQVFACVHGVGRGGRLTFVPSPRWDPFFFSFSFSSFTLTVRKSFQHSTFLVTFVNFLTLIKNNVKYLNV